MPDRTRIIERLAENFLTHRATVVVLDDRDVRLSTRLASHASFSA